MINPLNISHWYFDDANASLYLAVEGEDDVKVSLPKLCLIPSAFQENEFDFEDSTAMTLFIEQVRDLELTPAQQIELAVNATAAKRFHKPVQPKSWFFDMQDLMLEPEEGVFYQLSNAFNQGHFLTVDVEEKASLCLALDLDGFVLAEDKHLTFAEPIRVMNNRFIEADINFALQSDMWAKVG